MAQDSWPSPNHNSRNVTDPEYERIAARFSDDGVWGDPADSSVVFAGTGLEVKVRSGKFASLRGHAWTSGDSDVSLAIASNNSGQTRNDRVVLRLDRSTWDVRAVVKEGTPGAGVPSLVRDEGDTGVYEIPLASVTVPDAAASVTVARKELYIGQRIRPCTSDNRPTVGRPGELAYETDTEKLLVHGPGLSGYTTLYEDTGLLSLGSGFSTWEPVFSNVGQRVGPWVWLRVWVRRVGSTFSANDPDGSKIGTVPSALRSTYNNFFAAKFTGSGGNARVEVRNDGEIWVTHNDANVTVGRHLVLTMTYLKI